MERYLDITPGSVSVMGLMNDTQNRVQLLMDRVVAGAVVPASSAPELEAASGGIDLCALLHLIAAESERIQIELS